jgi:hypothetical protein
MKAIARDSCIFYAKVGREKDVRNKRDERGLDGYIILEDTWTNKDYPKNTIKGMGGKKPGRRFFSKASKVLAQDCSGTVYVFLPLGSGTTWSGDLADTIWATVEWPTLVANPNVDRVIRLDMNNANIREAIKGSLPKRSIADIEARDPNDKCTLYPGYRVFGHPNARLPGVLRCR